MLYGRTSECYVVELPLILLKHRHSYVPAVVRCTGSYEQTQAQVKLRM